MGNIIISPSFLGVEGYPGLRNFLNKIKQYGAQRVHVDFGDGQFIAEESKLDLLWQLSWYTDLPLEFHLMVQQPLKYFDFIHKKHLEKNKKNVLVIVHPEADGYATILLEVIKNYGFSCGIALKPKTLTSIIPQELFRILDLVVVMTVEPGQSGQAMLVEHLSKVEELSEIRRTNDYLFKIEVDGGVNEKTAPLAVRAGADILVSGGFIQKDPGRIKWLKNLKRGS